MRGNPSHSPIVCEFYKIGVEGAEPLKNKIIYMLNYFIYLKFKLLLNYYTLFNRRMINQCGY